MTPRTIEATRLYYELDRIFEWKKWAKDIPSIKFPPHWNIKIIPPFAGAMCRFTVKRDNSENIISVYLDCYDTLGIMEEPYWEIHPSSDGDCQRFLMNDIEGLLQGISEALGEVSEGDNKKLGEINERD